MCFARGLFARRAANFVRTDDGCELAANERILVYQNRRGARFGIESFFFQEGKGEDYGNAAYANIRLRPLGSAILVDLVKSP